MGRQVGGVETDRARVSVRGSWERRHSFRVHVPAEASVWHRGKLCGHYAVSDVSIGGCSLCGSAAHLVGEAVDLVLHLPHRKKLVLTARVCRADDRSIGLAFQRPTAGVEDCIQDIVLEAFAQKSARGRLRVLVVEPRCAERAALLDALAALGHQAAGVASALDAVRLLVEQEEQIDTAFIEVGSEQLPSLELVEFLASQHPRVRRILIGGESEIARTWIEQATGEVHAAVELPCDGEALHRVLHRLELTPADTEMA